MCDDILRLFKMNQYDPLIEDSENLPCDKGLYIISVRDKYALPEEMHNLVYSFVNERPIIYVGISSISLRERDYNNHFNGNARKSTLRKSIGSLRRYDRVWYPGEINTCRYRFTDPCEKELTMFMKANLLLNYYITDEYETIEKILIDYLNPPLNLQNNHNLVNKEFRELLSILRCKRCTTLKQLTEEDKKY